MGRHASPRTTKSSPLIVTVMSPIFTVWLQHPLPIEAIAGCELPLVASVIATNHCPTLSLESAQETSGRG